MATLNANPIVYQKKESAALTKRRQPPTNDADEDARDPWTAEEVFELIRHINDPEHPLTLEQLNVAQEELISVSDTDSSIDLQFTPTIPHCSMATLIGLCLRVKLLRSLPKRFKVSIRITPGTHASEAEVNKQLNDKERVAAALENQHLLEVVNRCLVGSEGDDEDEQVDVTNRAPPLAA